MVVHISDSIKQKYTNAMLEYILQNKYIFKKIEKQCFLQFYLHLRALGSVTKQRFVTRIDDVVASAAPCWFVLRLSS